ncbi:MAG: ABC transporter transmembrane domain-containing protein [Armatimonadota bacterium]
MLNSTLPDGIQLDESIRLCAEADLHPDGSLGDEWLVVTEANLLVFSKNGTGIEQRFNLPLSEVSEPKVANLVGGGALEVTKDGKPLELLRFTNRRSPDFATAAGVLEKWLKGETAELPEQEAQKCPKCGMPLEKGTKVCPFCAQRGKTLRRLVEYLRPHWLTAISLTLLATLSTALGLIPPYLQKPLVDDVLKLPVKEALSQGEIDKKLAMLGYLALILVAVLILTRVIGVIMSWLSSYLGNRITHDVRIQLYRHLQYLSLNFFDKRQMGQVISRVNQDTGQLQQFLVWGSQDLAINFLTMVGIGVMLFVLNWKLALLVLVPAPLVAMLSGRFWKRIRFYMHRFFSRWGRVNAILTETLNGMRVVRAFAQEPREIARFNEQSDELAKAGVKAEWTWAFLFSCISVLVMLGSMLVWYIGGRFVINDHNLFVQGLITNGKPFTLGDLLVFSTYVGMFYGPVQFMSMLLNWSSRSLTAAERIFEVLDSEPDVIEARDAVPLDQIAGKVTFKDVSFGYERHRPVLKKVNFEVAEGEMIGLVGHSGAGKSTTINLLCRFYDVNEGEILIDGVPIRQLKVADLRQQIGLVPQNTFLFSGTLAENISYAKPDASKEEIIRAAKVANAHDFIRAKPDGYEMLIGEGGKGLSGGEQQRLAIARAVLHNPRILILDEATSHVDVETEKQIQEATARLIKGRTTFAIAHRLSTLKNANRLIVLKGGEIAEIGTHDELLAKEEGEFHRLVQMYQEISKVQAVQR